MFVLAMKTTRWRLAACGVALGLLLTVMVTAGGQRPQVQSVGAGGDDAARIAYLQEQGCQVEPQWIDVREMMVPDGGGAVSAAYAGKRVKCFTYAVTGHPDGDGVVAHLYEYHGKIIGGDVAGKAFATGT